MSTKWMLFDSVAKAQEMDLLIAANMTAMFPLNPQSHWADVQMLKSGGAMINGVLCVCGYVECSLERGYSQAQVTNYLAGVTWDTIGTYPEENPEEWFDPFE